MCKKLLCGSNLGTKYREEIMIVVFSAQFLKQEKLVCTIFDILNKSIITYVCKFMLTLNLLI